MFPGWGKKFPYLTKLNGCALSAGWQALTSWRWWKRDTTVCLFISSKSYQQEKHQIHASTLKKVWRWPPGQNLHCSRLANKSRFCWLINSIRVTEHGLEWPLYPLALSLQTIHSNKLACFTQVNTTSLFPTAPGDQKYTRVWGPGTDFHYHRLTMQRSDL